jgi:uncharacterized membrane protein YfcA
MTLMLPLVVGLALGLLLGLLGGGGGIIAVPLLLALGQTMDAASTTSLVVVGIGAAAGLLMHARSGKVDWRIGLVFGLLGSAGAVAGSRLAFVVDDRIQLAGFVVLLLVAAWGMLRRKPSRSSDDEDAPLPDPRWGVVLLYATGVGLITGFFGVGGGFVAVPALVLALHMPMKRASATALLVILVNVTIAFVAHGTGHLDVPLTVTVSTAAAAGAVIGALLQARVPTLALQRAFGVLLVLAAGYETLVVLSVAS